MYLVSAKGRVLHLMHFPLTVAELSTTSPGIMCVVLQILMRMKGLFTI